VELQELQTKKVAVLGYGQEGKAVTSYLQKHGVVPTICDVRPFEKFSPEEQTLLTNAPRILGESYLDTLTDFKIVFRSPGIWRLHPKLTEAERKGVVISSQAKWFFSHSPAVHVGVTGTKGKGTTSSLVREILSAGFPQKQVVLTGNVGKTQPLEILDSLDQDSLVVYELSSFQLQDLDVSPHVACVLMVTSEHLDHHKDLAEYHDAKTCRNLV
jgi:UDP-N-acetylmuramoylalanine--D-glutamate ligase